MKIDNYSIMQGSSHSLQKSRSETEHLEVWSDRAQADEPPFIVDIKNRAFELSAEKTCKKNDLGEEEEAQKDPRIKLIESFIYQLTGKRIKFKCQTPIIEQNYKADTPGITFVVRGGRQDGSGFGMVYEYQEIVSEQENVKFDSGGYVTTADGRTIAFNLEFEMSREFYRQTNMSLRLGDAAKTVDPLVVVFENGAPTLTSAKHEFDLNADGTLESISFATGNSGFLALDKNADGIINNGSELFGPNSGDGFLELSEYDKDENGWIDENDEVFGQLMLLTMTQEGEKTLFKLGDVGIGAIYLNDISTQFSIKDESQEYGEMKSSSVFLREDGTAGTIHHIDLSV